MYVQTRSSEHPISGCLSCLNMPETVYNRSEDFINTLLTKKLDEADLNFDYTLDLASLDPKTYANVSTTQLFYSSNMYHDLLYDLGFDEPSGNFQLNNNGKGGLGEFQHSTKCKMSEMDDY